MGGAQIFFRCNPGLVPAGRRSATCVSPDGVSAVGTWTPDPAGLVCNGEIQNRHNSDETPLCMGLSFMMLCRKMCGAFDQQYHLCVLIVRLHEHLLIPYTPNYTSHNLNVLT